MSEILNNLNQEQKEAVTTIDGPILIIAGAGSGKTRALTHRIAYLIEQGVNPESILALTFTNKAAGEMKKRVHQLISLSADQFPTDKPTNWKTDLGFIGTFHAFAAKILRHEIQHLGYGKNFVIYDENDSLATVKEAMMVLGLGGEKFKPGGIYASISDQKNELTDSKNYTEKAKEFYEKMVAQVFEKYENYLKEANAVDFDDLLALAVKLFKQKPEVLEKYQNKFQYILVDEYQDTNLAQYVFLKLLAQKYQNLCVVGDDWQSIYSFRKADFRNILNFEKDYPKAKIVFLEENYRSTQNILDAAHAVIEKNVYKTQKNLWTKHGPGLKVNIVQAANEVEEGIFVVTEIKKILAALNKHSETNTVRDLNDFVILYRTNAQSRAMEEAIIQEGWPYRIIGSIKFYERREIKDIIAYLRLIQNDKDWLSLKRIANVPPRGIGKTTLDKVVSAEDLNHPKLTEFLNLMAELRKESNQKNASDFIKVLLDSLRYKDYCLDGTPEGEARWENVRELLTVASKFDNENPPSGLNILLEEIALTASTDDISDDKGCLNLMTLHSAKGLEFPVVFIIGAEDGLLPHSRSSFDPAQMEEERRLCYVGLTRAKEKIYLIFTRRRSIYGRTEPSLPSRFLGDIPARLVEFREYESEDEILDT